MSEVKIGDIGLLHTEDGVLPKAVQYFQQKVDYKSGYYNHSFIYYGDGVILEAAPKEWIDPETGEHIKGKLIHAAANFNTLSIYTDHPDKYEILWLTPKVLCNAKRIQYLMRKWSGTPYDFKNLLGDQIIQYLFGRWWGRNKKIADKLMVCHELVMRIYNEYSGIFPDWNKSRVADIYYSEDHIKQL